MPSALPQEINADGISKASGPNLGRRSSSGRWLVLILKLKHNRLIDRWQGLLLVSQRFDRVEPGGAASGIPAEEEADADGDQERQHHGSELDLHRQMLHLRRRQAQHAFLPEQIDLWDGVS